MSSNISKNILWLTISRIAALVLLFLAYRKLFHYLGPDVYGQYQFILSYVLIFSTVVDFGVQQFITKHISEDPRQAKKYFHSFLVFEVIAAFTLYAAAVSVAYFGHYGHNVTLGIAIAGLGMVANALCYPFMAVLASMQDLRKVALINFLNSVVNISIIFLAIIFHKSIVFLSFIQVAFGILDLILYRIFIKTHLPKPEVLRSLLDFDFIIIKKILTKAWPFALLVGFSAIYNRIDVIIITRLLGYLQAGFYGAAYKFYDLLNFFPAAVSFTLFPYFASLMTKGATLEVKSGLEKYTRLMLMVALPMAVGGMVLAKPLVLLMTNGDLRFLPAVAVLPILIWAPAIQFIYIPVNSLVISQLTKKAMLITGANVIINIVGNLLLIPHFGIKAAAAMTVVSESLQGLFYFYFVNQNITKFKFFSFLYKPLLAAAIMGLVLWPLRTYSLILTLSVGFAVYLVLLIVTRFVKKEDLLTLKALF